MREIVTRGVSLVNPFVIGASITFSILFSTVVLSFTSVPNNGLFIYAVDIASLVVQGNNAYDEGKSEEAIQYFDQALAVEPHNVSALVNEGLALDDLNRTEEAIQYYDRALA
ncbi:MAG: tetratricopeptide repeat protein, partial [Nitrososphaeraceae archaeon]